MLLSKSILPDTEAGKFLTSEVGLHHRHCFDKVFLGVFGHPPMGSSVPDRLTPSDVHCPMAALNLKHHPGPTIKGKPMLLSLLHSSLVGLRLVAGEA